MSEDQEKAARVDAIEDDEVISTRQRTERQEALKDAAWKRLRQELHDGKLVGFVQGNDGGHPKEIEASKWSGRWAENAHKQDAFSNYLVKEAELESLLGGEQPQAAVTKRRGGRPEQYHWPAFFEEAIRILEDEGGFDPKLDPAWRQARLEERMTKWCGRTWGREPTVSTVRLKVTKAITEFRCRKTDNS